MAKDNYRDWRPLPGVPAKLYCEGLQDDYEHFRILLRPGDRSEGTIRIVFDSPVAYRNVNESYRGRTWRTFQGYRAGSLFVVEDSGWVQWLRQESDGVLDAVDLVHYAIFTPEDCVEVVSEFAPQVEWLKK